MPGKPFVIKRANCSKEAMTLPKRMVVAQCSAVPTVVVCPLEEPIDAVQLYENQESKEGKLEQN